MIQRDANVIYSQLLKYGNYGRKWTSFVTYFSDFNELKLTLSKY